MRTNILSFLLLITLFPCCIRENNKNTCNIITDEIQIDKLKVPSEFTIDSHKLLGKFDYKKDSTFTKVPRSYSFKNIYIQKVVLDSFINMANTAKKVGISLKIISGTRNFDEQKAIWERKWNRNEVSDSIANAMQILKFSSMPSTSRHHWGTDIDLNNLNNSYFEKGQGLKEYNWLVRNAFKFGFFQPYTSKEFGRSGYNEEKWHWSFKPLSFSYLNVYNNSITHKDINGFIGSSVARNIDVIKFYVNGIEY